MPTNYNGQLRSNEIFAAIYNMIISQQVFADNIAGTNAQLVDKARVDGSMHGDTKLYYSTDALKSSAWGNDAEAADLLKLYRPEDPSCQAIYLDKFRQIALTTDNYLSKRAWSTEGAFSSFNSVMKGWIRDTKRIYDATTYNCYFGTAESAVGKQSQEITISTAAGAGNEAQQIADFVADLMVEMTDISRDFNDYGYLRSYNPSDIHIVWKSSVVNKMRHIDLPVIYHKDGVEKTLDMGTWLPDRYFGKVQTAATPGDGTTVRSLIEQEIGDNHYFAGDLIKSGDTAPANTSYKTDDTILCKIYVKLPPFMSAFEVGTSFFNPKSLTENNYLTWGHNTIQYLYNYPLITVRKGA